MAERVLKWVLESIIVVISYFQVLGEKGWNRRESKEKEEREIKRHSKNKEIRNLFLLAWVAPLLWRTTLLNVKMAKGIKSSLLKCFFDKKIKYLSFFIIIKLKIGVPKVLQKRFFEAMMILGDI